MNMRRGMRLPFTVDTALMSPAAAVALITERFLSNDKRPLTPNTERPISRRLLPRKALWDTWRHMAPHFKNRQYSRYHYAVLGDMTQVAVSELRDMGG